MKAVEDIALVDMDGTLADYDEGLRKSILPFISEVDNSWDIYDPNKPEHIKRLFKFVRQQNGFWKSLPVIPSGLFILNKIKEAGFHIHILTKGPFSSLNAWTEKVEWCNENLSHLGRIGEDYGISITSDKGLVYGKILFDDYVPYCKRWLEWRPRGLVIQLETKQNKDWNHPNVVRFNGTNLDEVVSKIHEAKQRTGLFG